MSKIKEVERKNKILVILLCIALVFVMMLGSYVIYNEVMRDREINENNDIDSEDETILEDNNVDSDDDNGNVNDNGIINTPVIYKNPFIDENDEFNKLFIDKTNIVESVGSYHLSNLEDIFSTAVFTKEQIPVDKRLYSIIRNVDMNCKQFNGCSVDSKDSFIHYIDATLVDSEYVKLYGVVDYQHKSLNIGCPMVEYDVSNNRYIARHYCGGTGYPSLVEIVESVNVDGDYVYVQKGVGCSKNNILYKDYKCSQEIKKRDDYSKEKLEKDDYLALNQYKYTFVKNGDNYIFEKIEKVS